MLVIGIDPGLTGALAAVDHRGLQAVIDMPVMQRALGAGMVKKPGERRRRHPAPEGVDP